MNFSEYSAVSKRPSQKQFQNICEIAKTKSFFVSNQKVLLSSFLRGTSCLLFVVVTPASDECLNFGHLPAVIVVPRACVCIFVDLR